MRVQCMFVQLASCILLLTPFCSFVISNQALLTLIEKPIPNNLIALYTSFPGAVPPLIRKRGNELLQLMQDAASTAPETEAVSNGLEPDHNVLMEVDEAKVIVDAPRHIVFSTQATPVPDLWAAPALSTPIPGQKIATSRSSLFGSIANAARSVIPLQLQSSTSFAATKLSTRHSSFLGTGSKSTTLAAVTSGDRVQQAIAKIHDGILKSDKKVITVQTGIKSSTTPADVPNSKPPADERPVHNDALSTPNLPMEVPFVPRSQRLTTQAIDSDIVQVGQRKKKRKRADEAEAESSQRRKKTPRASRLSADNVEGDEDKETTPELQVFDYSAEPNILDEGMKGVDGGGTRKGKHSKRDATKGTQDACTRNFSLIAL